MIIRLIILISVVSVSYSFSEEHLNGIDVFFNSDLKRYEHLRLGIVLNHTSQDKNGNSLVDLAREHLNLRAIFTPEHGLFGRDEAGKKINDGAYNGVPVYSLYGNNRMPTTEQLKDLDFIIFDIQDIAYSLQKLLTSLHGTKAVLFP